VTSSKYLHLHPLNTTNNVPERAAGMANNASSPIQTKTTDGEGEERPTNILSPQHTEEDNRFLVMDLSVHLNDVHATVPLFTRDISYVSNALIRPIVAYINNKKAFIPVNCRVVKRASEFAGSWTVYDSGLMEDLSREVSVESLCGT